MIKLLKIWLKMSLMLTVSSISIAETLPTNLKNDYSCLSESRQKSVEVCFREQDLKRSYEDNKDDEDDSVSPWATFFMGMAAGALLGIYVGHH